MKNHYRKLKIKTDAGPEAIKKKFSKVVSTYARKRLTESNARKLMSLKYSYDVLVNPVARSKYDVEIGLVEPGHFCSWRDHYRSYRNGDVEEDLKFGQDLIDNFNQSRRGSFQDGIWIPILILFFILILMKISRLLLVA